MAITGERTELLRYFENDGGGENICLVADNLLVKYSTKLSKISKFQTQIQGKKESLVSSKVSGEVFRNENGAIDLASIMVGIIVIGLIGGVIAATVFAVIPWTQDNAAKHQLDSIAAAQSAYMGLSSDSPPALPAGHKANSFADSASLASASLLQTGSTYCAVTTDNGKGYQGYSQSSSGKIWTMKDSNTKPWVLNEANDGPLPADCNFITVGFESGDNSGGDETGNVEVPYVDPTPTKTIMTFKCAANTTDSLPFNTNIKGKETWVDNSTGATVYDHTYTVATQYPADRILTANVEYKVVFDGTYDNFFGYNNLILEKCLTSVDHWGSESGVKNATSAFNGATKLVNVPANIPATITNANNMFVQAELINDPDISKWNVSNIANMSGMFMSAPKFNQPLNDWNVANVNNMSRMFEATTGYTTYAGSTFNQPLDKWDTSKVTTMTGMFFNAKAFNQPLDNWNVSLVTNMGNMFRAATAFNQPLASWKVEKVLSMDYMFYGATAFKQNLSGWPTTSLSTTGAGGEYFASASVLPLEYFPARTKSY